MGYIIGMKWVHNQPIQLAIHHHFPHCDENQPSNCSQPANWYCVFREKKLCPYLTWVPEEPFHWHSPYLSPRTVRWTTVTAGVSESAQLSKYLPLCRCMPRREFVLSDVFDYFQLCEPPCIEKSTKVKLCDDLRFISSGPKQKLVVIISLPNRGIPPLLDRFRKLL